MRWLYSDHLGLPKTHRFKNKIVENVYHLEQSNLRILKYDE